MKLQRLAVEQLRQFRAPFELADLAPGLNLFTGPNEAGKSTLVRAIRAAFFDRHRSSVVEDLRPWGEAAASPTVELDFTVAGVQYHLRKSFLQRKRCELKSGAQSLDGEAAEQHLAELLGFGFPGKGASSARHWGIPGLLWIEQGQTHEIEQPVEHAADHLRNALEASVGEVASTQGDALIAQVREGRGQLLTPSTDQPRGELRRVLDECEALERDLAELDAKVDGYRRQVDRLAALRAGHAEALATRPWDSMRAQQQAAEQALARSEAMVRELDAARGSLKQVEARVQLLEQQRTAHDEALRSLVQREAGLDEAARRLEAAVAVEARRSEEDARARADCDATAAQLEHARQADLRRDLRLRAAEAAARVKELDALLQRAEAEAGRIDALRQHAAATAIDKADLERLRALAADLEAVRLRRQVMATRLRFDLHDGAAVTLDGEALRGGAERLAAAPATIEIAGVGRIEVVPGGDGLGTLARDEADAAAARDALLARCGVADLAVAEARHAEHRQATQEAAQAGKVLAGLAPKGIDALKADRAAQVQREADARARLAALAGSAAAAAGPGDAGAGDAAADAGAGIEGPAPSLAEAEAAHSVAKARADVIAGQLAEARQARLVAAERHEAALRERAALKGRLDSPEQQARQQEAGQLLLAALAERDALRAAIAARAEAVEGTQPDVLKQTVERYRRSVELAMQAHQARESEITLLTGKLDEAGAQGHDEARAATAVRLEAARRRRQELERRAKALDLLLGRLEARRRESTRRLRAPLQARIDHYLRLLFPKAVLEVGDDLLPGLLTRATEEGEAAGAVAALSHGAREQLGVLVRLAYADLLRDAGRPTLLILDDALVHSDAERLDRMKRVLFDASHRHQVLLFTCHPERWQDMGVAARRIERR